MSNEYLHTRKRKEYFTRKAAYIKTRKELTENRNETTMGGGLGACRQTGRQFHAEFGTFLKKKVREAKQRQKGKTKNS